jgi:protein farnesyltransferase subunit beta
LLLCYPLASDFCSDTNVLYKHTLPPHCPNSGGAEIRGGIDTRRLKRWLSARQIGAEGGFNGRTCKLVDACYAFWQGGTYACLPALEQGLARNAAAQQQPGPAPAHRATPAALVATPDRAALQQYLLAACQASDGGMRDKPGKSPDFYHTCYALSGLAIVQHGTYALGPWVAAHGAGAGGVVGDPANALERINPVFNLSERAVAYWRENVLS